MMMMFGTVVIVVVVGVVDSSSSTAVEKKEHNKEEHDRLCAVLRAAVSAWEGVKGRSPEDPLKKALHQTIFGYGIHEQEVEKLRNSFPSVYNGDGVYRGIWCGQPRHDGEWMGENQARWSGHSASHDLVCLCTVGNNSFPLNGTVSSSSTLCGRGRVDLKADDKQGWTGNGNDGKEQINATWDNVTSKCLENDGETGDLKEKLGAFKKIMVHNPDTAYSNRDLLGEGGKGVSACNGSGQVCVMYYTTLTAKIWWVDLEKALIEDEQIQKKLSEDAAEKHKQKDEAEKKDSPQAEALKSGSPNTKQTEQHHKDNITEKLRKYNLTSGTPIIPPSSWLLSVVFLY